MSAIGRRGGAVTVLALHVAGRPPARRTGFVKPARPDCLGSTSNKHTDLAPPKPPHHLRGTRSFQPDYRNILATKPHLPAHAPAITPQTHPTPATPYRYAKSTTSATPKTRRA